jgi:hypothetical protein
MKRHLQLLHSLREVPFRCEGDLERAHFQYEEHYPQQGEHCLPVAYQLAAESRVNASNRGEHSYQSKMLPWGDYSQRGFAPAPQEYSLASDQVGPALAPLHEARAVMNLHPEAKTQRIPTVHFVEQTQEANLPVAQADQVGLTSIEELPVGPPGLVRKAFVAE